MDDLTAITCESVGVSGTTKIHFRQMDCFVVARVGISILGMTNQDHGPDANPFDPLFHDNFAEGAGKDREDALLDLKEDLRQISNSIWFDS